MVAGAAASGAEWADKAELLANKAYADPASHERGVQGYVLAHFMQVRRGLGASVCARVGGRVRWLSFLCCGCACVQDWRGLRLMMGVTDDDLATALHLMMAIADHTEPQVPGALLNHKRWARLPCI
jgi:hypothetical protein